MQRRALIGAAAGAVAASRAAPARRLGVALGSGALHGWAHVGVVRACRRIGVMPAVITGSSAGAFVGALWAGGLSERSITEIAQRMDWGSTGSWSLSARGLKRNTAVREAVDQALGGRSIEQLPVRFAAVASDARSGEPVLLDRGPAGLAVMASSAVPVWFEPVRIGQRDLLDGGLTAPVPVDAARSLGANLVIAVDIAYRPHEQALSGLADLAFQAIHILTNALSREQTRRADHTLRLDLHHLMVSGLDPETLIAAGEAAMLRLEPVLLAKDDGKDKPGHRRAR